MSDICDGCRKNSNTLPLRYRRVFMRAIVQPGGLQFDTEASHAVTLELCDRCHACISKAIEETLAAIRSQPNDR